MINISIDLQVYGAFNHPNQDRFLFQIIVIKSSYIGHISHEIIYYSDNSRTNRYLVPSLHFLQIDKVKLNNHDNTICLF